MSNIHDELSFWRRLRSLPPRGSYGARLLVVCFLGTHVPLVAAALWAVTTADGGVAAHFPILAVLLLATLTGTAATLYFIHRLLAPVRVAARALHEFTTERRLPNLPLDGEDDAGYLLASVRNVCERLDAELRHQEHLATTDALSGLLVRRAFLDACEAHLAQARRRGRLLHLIILDLDHFKSINDTFGHAAGDEAISTVGAVVTRWVAGRGLARRLGGEEFAALIIGESTEEVRRSAYDLLAAIRCSELRSAPSRRVTASAGLTAIDPFRDPSVGGPLERADAALFEAKAGGRDRLHLVSPRDESSRAAGQSERAA